MSKKRIILNIIIVIAILIGFVIINVIIESDFKKTLKLVSDGSQYCYGIDSLEMEENTLTMRGWFFELKNIQGTERKVVDDAELMLALVPLEEANAGDEIMDAPLMNVIGMHEERSDVNEYFLCGIDYSKCGFTATIDSQKIDLSKTVYRLAVKQDSSHKATVLTDVYLTADGIKYTNPELSPELETGGTDLDKIVKEGVRLVSRPEYNCYVYQFEDKLYWITDEGFTFCEDGSTYIQYQMNTTQIDKLPAERLENNWLWSNIGDYFELHEITDQINCGKYRVSVRDIPKEYSVTNVCTGYYDGDWVWYAEFKPNYRMLWKKTAHLNR